MASSHEVAEYVRHASRPFIFSASITPASCATALAALRYLEAHPEIVDRLNALSAYARDGLRKKKVKIIESTTPIIPLYTYTVENTLTAARQLYDAGVYVNPVLPPATPLPSACCAPVTWPPLPNRSSMKRSRSLAACWGKKYE